FRFGRCQDGRSFLYEISVVLEHRGVVSLQLRRPAGADGGDPDPAERARVRAHRVRPSVADASAAPVDGDARKRVGRVACRADRLVAVSPTVAGDRVAGVSRLLHRALARAACATAAGARRMIRVNRRTQDRVAGVLFACLVAATAILVVWSMRQGWAVYKLRRGVGDTWFYAADGRPWFRMDEQRRDVSLDEVSPDLRNAIVAVEDHRFYHHFGIDPIGFSRALWRDVRG